MWTSYLRCAEPETAALFPTQAKTMGYEERHCDLSDYTHGSRYGVYVGYDMYMSLNLGTVGTVIGKTKPDLPRLQQNRRQRALKSCS